MLKILSLSGFLPIMLIFINSLVHKKYLLEREKLSSFECGFDPLSTPRNPFSLKFYLIAIMFLIFDIEITLILPIPPSILISPLHSLLLISSYFTLILLGGLFYEWKEGALNWVI